MPVSIGGSGFITGLDQGIDGVGIITATSFSGPLTGNVTGDLTSSGVSTVGQLNVGTGGTVITTTAGGLVGIGTDNLDRKLVISQANGTAYSGTDFDQDYHVLKLNNTTDSKTVGIQFLIGSNGEAAITATETSDGATDLIVGTRGGGSRAERLRVESDGDILIGDATNYAYIRGWAPTTGDMTIGADQSSTGTGGSNLIFRSRGGEKLRITSGGTVGINTDGDPTFGGFATPQVYVKSTSSSWTGGIHLEASASDSVGVINHSSDGLEIAQTYRSGGSYQPIIFRTSGTERLRIDTGGRVTLPYQPGFRVYSPSAAVNSIITFGNTEFNTGNHMDAATGVFTAPIAGRYLFTFAILSGNPLSSYVRINFCKNSTSIDTTLGDSLWDGLSTFGSPSMAMIFDLAVNDTIRLRAEGSGTYSTSYGSFSGILLG